MPVSDTQRNLGVVVAGLHALLLAYVVLGPFVLPVQGLCLIQYMCILAFLVLHWVTNNDTCALSIMEATFRELPIEQTFVHSVVSPVYKMNWSANGYVIIAVLFVAALARAIHGGAENFSFSVNKFDVLQENERRFDNVAHSSSKFYTAVSVPTAIKPGTQITPDNGNDKSDSRNANRNSARKTSSGSAERL